MSDPSRVALLRKSEVTGQDAAEDQILVGDFVATAGASKYSLILARIDEIKGDGPMAVLKMTTKANRKVTRLAGDCVKTMRQDWKEER